MKKILSVFRTFSGFDDSFFYSYFNMLCNNKEISYINFDDTTFINFEVNNLESRLARRLIRTRQVRLFNDTIKYYLKYFKPDLFIFFKANYLDSDTIILAKESGATIFAIYPDLEPKIYGNDYLSVLNLSDILIHTKPNLIDYFKSLNNNSVCVFPFYSIKCVSEILPYDKNVGVLFIGHYSKGKEQVINKFSERLPVKFNIFGTGWENKIKNKNVKIHKAIFGLPVYHFYQQSLFVMGLLTERLNDFKAGDIITSRSIQIPAYGGLCLHPRNHYAEDIFGKNHKMLFKSIDEAENIFQELSQNLNLRKELFFEQQNNVLDKGTQIELFLNYIINDFEKGDFSHFNIFS